MCTPIRAIFLIVTLTLSAGAAATIVEVLYHNVGGDRYVADYVIDNDLALPIYGVLIDYEAGLYDNLTLEDSPVDWDVFVDDPDPAFDLEGIADAFASVAPLLPGELLSGLSVSFDYFGLDAPSGETFTLFDADFTIIGEGRVTVPEPSAASMVILALFTLVALRSYRRLQAAA